MTLIPVYKKCSKCKKKYSWNPDVGNMFCPNCGFLDKSGIDDVSMLDDEIVKLPWEKKKKD